MRVSIALLFLRATLAELFILCNERLMCSPSLLLSCLNKHAYVFFFEADPERAVL